MEDHDLIGAEQDVDGAADVADRDRVAADPDGDHAVAIDARVEGQPRLERLAGQGQQEWCLVGEVLADGADPHADPPVLFGLFECGEGVVELVEGVDAGHGGEVVAAPVADLALDAALLVGAAKSRLAVEGGDRVVLAEVVPARVLFS